MSVKYQESTADLNNRIRAHKLFSKSSLDEVLNSCLDQLPSRSTIMDLGCGSGNFYELLSGRSCSYMGIDVSPALLAEFRSRHGRTAILIKANMDDLPCIYGGSFDAVFSIYSIYYSLRPLDLIANLRSLLSNNGRLFVIGPSQQAHAPEIDIFCRTIALESDSRGNKDARIANFHSIIIPEISRQFSSVTVTETDGSLYFPDSQEWAKYVISTPQVREQSDEPSDRLMDLAIRFSASRHCLSVSKYITTVRASR